MYDITHLDSATTEVLNDLEATRINLRKKRAIHLAICLSGIPIAIIGFAFIILPMIAIGIICFFTGLICISVSLGDIDQYRLDFKQRLVTQAIKTIDQSLEIDPKRGLSQDDFFGSLLFNKKPDKYMSEDRVSGNAGKTKFSFSEVRAEYKELTITKKGTTQETWHEIFFGVMFQADFNKNFKGLTVVQPKTFGSDTSEWFGSNTPFFSGSKERIKLENPEFEKHFATYSSDQIEARYILTPLLMESICKLNERCEDRIGLSFVGNVITIAFPLSRDYFEAPLFGSLMTDGLLKEDMELVRHIYQVIETLDLNTRIWGKN